MKVFMLALTKCCLALKFVPYVVKAASYGTEMTYRDLEENPIGHAVSVELNQVSEEATCTVKLEG